MNPWAEQRAVRPRVLARLPMVRGLCEELNLTAMNLLTAFPITQPVPFRLVQGRAIKFVMPDQLPLLAGRQRWQEFLHSLALHCRRQTEADVEHED